MRRQSLAIASVIAQLSSLSNTLGPLDAPLHAIWKPHPKGELPILGVSIDPGESGWPLPRDLYNEICGRLRLDGAGTIATKTRSRLPFRETLRCLSNLIILSGLPGSGKSTIARGLALATDAVWLRIDSIEQAIRHSGVVPGSLDDAGYRAAQAVAEDNLRLGRDVISDSVNDWKLTRDAWRDVGVRAGARVFEVEVVCSEPEEHRRRVETRESEVAGLVLPTWKAVLERDYHPWDRDHLVIDTAGRSVSDCVAQVVAQLTRAER